MKELNIDWANMPAWAEVWIEDASKECSGWHKSGKRYQDECWEDDNGSFYYKNSEYPRNYTVHYPPIEDTNMKELIIDWANMPAWAECWIEDADPQECGGWYKSGERSAGDCWEDDKGLFYYKNSEHPDNYTVHFPPRATAEWNWRSVPPVGAEVEVYLNGVWVGATTVGLFRNCMVCAPNGGGFFGFKEDEIRPVKNKRQKWIDMVGGLTPAQIYDALASGDLDSPSKEV